MASNVETTLIAASADPAAKQENTDGWLQFDADAYTKHITPPDTKIVAFVSATSDSDEDGDAFKKNPFLDPDVAAHWTAVYEKSKDEC